jgi:hypothetical protein
VGSASFRLDRWPSIGPVLLHELERDNQRENAYCLVRIVREVLTVASLELLPARGREEWHATGKHGDER